MALITTLQLPSTQGIYTLIITTPLVEKTVENRFRWFGYAEGRLVNLTIKRVDYIKDSRIIRFQPRKLKKKNY